MTARNLLIIISFLFIATPAIGAENYGVKIERNGKTYQLEITARIVATPQRVLQLLSDYLNLDKINDAILLSEILQQDENKQRVKLITEACVFFFCKTFTHVQDVIDNDGIIIATIIPQFSDFKDGWAKWSVTTEPDGNAKLHVVTHLTPNFWVPPVIGPLLIKRKLSSETIDTIKRLEYLSTLAL